MNLSENIITFQNFVFIFEIYNKNVFKVDFIFKKLLYSGTPQIAFMAPYGGKWRTMAQYGAIFLYF